MSNPIFNRPDYLKKGDGALTKAAMGGLGMSTPQHIEANQGMFSLISASRDRLKSIPTHLDVIVLDSNEHLSKVYYDTDYQAGNPQPPKCHADNGIGPSVNAREPQSRLCADCPQNVWGSGKPGLNGSRTKACRDLKKLVVWTQEDKSTQYLFVVPPASLTAWNAYCGWLLSEGAEVWQVVTRISFANDPKRPNTLLFDVAQRGNGDVAWVPKEFEAWYRPKLEARKWDLLLGRDDKPIGGVEAAAIAGPSSDFALPNRTLPPAKPEAPVEGASASAWEAEAQEAIAEPPAKRRPGRPRGSSNKAEGGNGKEPDLPEFLQRTSPGMGEAPAPNADLGSAIDDAFKS